MLNMLLTILTAFVGMVLAFLAGIGVAVCLAASKYVLAAICFTSMVVVILLMLYIIMYVIN